METSFRVKLGAHLIDLYEGETIIGRDEQCGVCLEDDQVSRRHASITVRNGKAVLMDLDSKNGTKLNGDKVRAPAALKDGDKISIGSQTLLLMETRSRSREKSGLRSGTLDGFKARQPLPTMASIDPHHAEVGGGVSAEADLLRKSLQMGRWKEAERLLKARVTRLLTASEPPSPLDPRVEMTVQGLLRLAQHEMDPVWLDRLFKLYATLRWWMNDRTLQNAVRLMRAMGQVGGNGLKEYISYWNRHDSELEIEERTILSRLETEVQMLFDS